MLEQQEGYMRPTIALFVAHPYCSTDSANGIMRALDGVYRFKLFSDDTVANDFFDDVDMIAVPGGIGDADNYFKLMGPTQDSIRQFVADGGAYLGICMGAYWAGSRYLDILDGVDAGQYITRPDACTRRPHPKGMPVTWNGTDETMYFYDGCALVGNKRKFKTVATYSNGDAMAIQQGRVGLIGCHPESTAHWYRQHAWMEKHWHKKRHHRLLKEFVDEVMEG